MKSPFPGMDPYIEPNWLDVQTALAGETRRTLNRTLPKGLVARVEERVAIESDDDVARRIGPDGRVFSPSTADPEEGKGGAVIDAPFKLMVELDPIIERFVRVIDEAGRLITVIEFLSPTNKQQPGLDDYVSKRSDLLKGGVNVVEVDLVRAGDWRAEMRPERCPAEAWSTYRIVIRTPGPRPRGYLFPCSLRQPLPDTPVPLRLGDDLIHLPLQSLLETVYQDGRYDHTIDYNPPLNPSLEEAERAWVDELLKVAGKR